MEFASCEMVRDKDELIESEAKSVNAEIPREYSIYPTPYFNERLVVGASFTTFSFVSYTA